MLRPPTFIEDVKDFDVELLSLCELSLGVVD